MIQFYELFSLELDKDYLVNHRGVSSNWNLNWTHETRGAVEQNQMMEMGALIQGFFQKTVICGFGTRFRTFDPKTNNNGSFDFRTNHGIDFDINYLF